MKQYFYPNLYLDIKKVTGLGRNQLMFQARWVMSSHESLKNGFQPMD
jgi:hypothetical protein